MDELKTYTVKVVLECEFTFKTVHAAEDVKFSIENQIENSFDFMDGTVELDGPFKCDVKVVEK
jgi:hypothetical protein